jgi:hypothetical protein
MIYMQKPKRISIEVQRVNVQVRQGSAAALDRQLSARFSKGGA